MQMPQSRQSADFSQCSVDVEVDIAATIMMERCDSLSQNVRAVYVIVVIVSHVSAALRVAKTQTTA